MAAAPGSESRPVNPALMFGLVAVPILFVWFLFLPGYARSLRIVALVYAFMPFIFVGVGLAVGLLFWAFLKIASSL